MIGALTASKSDLIALVNALGVPIKSDTKLNVTELETKLRESLDECQTIKDIPDLLGADGYVDLQGLPEYQLDPGTKMLDEVRRHSIAEALETQRRAMTGEDPHARGDTQPFYDLRQTLMSIGNQWDQGAERIIVLDELRRSYIFLRIVKIHTAALKTPLMALLFLHDVSDTAPKVRAWRAELETMGSVPVINATIAEQRLLLRLLEGNSKRLRPGALAPLTRASEQPFSASFLLPVGPLASSAKDSMALDAPRGCGVCGIPSSSYCSGCRAIFYCSPEHAKENWKAHKLVCKRLTGAEWLNIPLPRGPKVGPGGKGQFFTTFNMNSTAQNLSASQKIQALGDLVPNTHGSTPFLIKIQTDIPARASLLIYDQERTFQTSVMRGECPVDVWKKLQDAILEHGPRGLKLFAWARRTSDWEISVTIDRLPQQASIFW